MIHDTWKTIHVVPLANQEDADNALPRNSSPSGLYEVPF
jgi:hypothetical protein